MIFNLCPACQHVNAADAQRCAACGAWLVEDSDTVPAALLHAPEPMADSAGALWFEELGLAPLAPEPAPPGATGEVPLSITLRQIGPPPVPPGAFGRLARDEPSPAPLPHEDDDFVLSYPELPLEPAPVIEVRNNILAADDEGAAARAAVKAARRAAVRRARLGPAAAPPGAAVDIPEVMVLDPDDHARTPLCTLLGSFGFRVHPVLDIEQATELAAERPFAALFVDVALDGSDAGAGVQMCRRVKGSAAPGAEPPVLVLVSAQLSPVDRVRAQLAGCDGMLQKPVQRGDVARLLEDHGVALPSDARQR
jgi:CheY-like chemotaxis protein